MPLGLRHGVIESPNQGTEYRSDCQIGHILGGFEQFMTAGSHRTAPSGIIEYCSSAIAWRRFRPHPVSFGPMFDAL